ncbi:ABC transporter permease [Micropruina sp.]|uniref:ABC transporter permease n=1 Tax=Micropruina sp. TaxID=2737536 RepID=UPI0039E5EB2F
MRRRALFREIIAATWAARVPSALIVIVAGMMCFTAIVTVGRSAAAAREVAARLEQAGARRMSVTDGGGLGLINARTVAAVQSLSTVETADALGAPFDATNGIVGPGGQRVPVWPVLGGDVSRVVNLVWGRAPRRGEALVSVDVLDQLRLSAPVGYLTAVNDDAQYPIVGVYRARPVFEDLNTGAVLAPIEPVVGRELRVVVTGVASASNTVSAVLSILAPPPEAQGIYVDAPTVLADTARDINTQLAGTGRALLLLILAAGGFFVAAVVLADVLVRRRDLGRRRTLGVSRADLIGLVAGRAILTATVGSLIGCIAGWTMNQSIGSETPIDFTVGVGVLAVVSAGMAVLGPAWYAARLDPVAVMRTP